MRMLKIPSDNPYDYIVRENIENDEIELAIFYDTLELRFETTSSVVALLDMLLTGLDRIMEFKKLLLESTEIEEPF